MFNSLQHLKQTSLISLVALLGLWVSPAPAQAQALVPYVLPVDYELLEEQGQFLAAEAQQLAQFQQFNQALRLAQLAAQLAPNDAQVLGLLGGLYLQSGDTDTALAILEQAETLDPDDPRILFSLGAAHFQQENYAQAAATLEAGLALEPDNPSALFDLGNAYFLLQRYNDAIARYNASVAAEPAFWPSVNNIGLVLYEQGDAEGAIARWQEALDISANEPEPKLAIAVALYAQGDSTGLAQGMEALEQDSRYADLDFLTENLWGSTLLADTEAFFQVPVVQALLDEL